MADWAEEYWHHSADRGIGLVGNVTVSGEVHGVLITGTNVIEIIFRNFLPALVTYASYLMFHILYSLNLHSDRRPFVSLVPVLVFRRYEFHPVCADLQAKILQCYRQNTQQTLSCSALADQYMRCVNQAKQVGVPARLNGAPEGSEPSIIVIRTE